MLTSNWKRVDIYRIFGFIGFVALVYFTQSPLVGGFIFAVIILISIGMFLMPYWPGLIRALSNEPNALRPIVNVEGLSQKEKFIRLANVPEYKPSTFAFFTGLKPGRVKAIVRDDRFQRFIMRFDGSTFKGDLRSSTAMPITLNSRDYWDIEETPPGEEDSHPIPTSIRKGKLDLLWLWSRHVYNVTGFVFTGVPDWQTVDVYKLEQFHKHEDDDGSIYFLPYRDYSDHVRAGEYQFFVKIKSAETADQVKVTVWLAVTIQVINPYRAKYDADDKWASRLFTAISTEITAHLRGLPYLNVIANKPDDKEQRNQQLSEVVHRLNNKSRSGGRISRYGIWEIGLYIKDTEVLDLEVDDPELAKKLAIVAQEKAGAEAAVHKAASRRTLAKAEADAVEMVASVARRNGEAGMRALERESDIRTADAATKNGGDVILNIGGNGGKGVSSDVAFLRKSIEGSSES